MFSPKQYRKELQTRVARWRAFHQRKEPGDLLVYVPWDRAYSLEGFLTDRLKREGVQKCLDEAYIPTMIGDYVALLRDTQKEVFRIRDDTVPSALVYWGIGSITAAMTALEPFHDGITSWLEPTLSWEQINQLRFDPDNKWIQFALHVNQALWNLWDEDYHVLPFLHRSPLDAANGIRGTELFTEMYTDPKQVHRLLNWCVDWQLALERFLDRNVKRPAPSGWGTAVWGAWLPDGGVFVNGDPVGLISREMALEFEQPYTARLFTNTGGGFFHNHSVGLYQADLVSSTPGTLVQFFVNDPKQPTGPQALLDIPDLREKLLAGSLKAPIGINGVPLDRLDELLDIARHGRFVLAMDADIKDPSRDFSDVIQKVRAVSKLK